MREERLPFRSCGKDVTVYSMARVIDPERISIGDAVTIDDFVFLSAGRSTSIGSFVHLAAFSSYAGGGELLIDDFAGISMGTRVFTGTDDFMGAGLTGPKIPAEFRAVERSFVRIGKYVIIGANSVILPAVRIGEGVAIGANSLVTSDCEPWTLYAGTPARPIKKRQKQKMLEQERALRASLYDGAGQYLPKQRR
jgi:acetyltransferase-like isoleucine patch superfamily enzyme